MKFGNRQNECVMLQDGRTVWLSRAVAINVILLLEMNNQLFVAMEQRGPNSADFQGMWCLPCGYLDWDEYAHEAVRREVWEEIGIDILDLMEEKCIAHYIFQPWHVNTSPAENRQNVSLSHAIHFTDTDFPRLTLGEQEGESSATEWKPVSWIYENQDLIAFNHALKVDSFLRLRGIIK